MKLKDFFFFFLQILKEIFIEKSLENLLKDLIS